MSPFDPRRAPDLVAPQDPSQADPRAELEALVPHRGAMLLLDALVHSDAEQTRCRVNLHEGSSFLIGGAVPAVVMLEYMAQAVAAHAGRQAQGGPRVGYLVGVRELELLVPEVKAGTSLLVQVRHVWSNGISGSFDGQVSDGERVIARARLSVFVPPQEGFAP